jgi:hypothetical protein
MANSKLATWKWSGSTSNYNTRDHKIDKITIHHQAGNLTPEQTAQATESRGGSWNYCITSQGNIGVMIDEKYRAWTSSNRENDMRAVTIEVANDRIGGNWHVSDKALKACINLCVDICKRNGIKKLNYTGDTSGNLTMHCMFAATACPGPYLKSKFKYIADEVNKQLSGSTTSTKKTTTSSTASKSTSFKAYKVKVTANCLNIRKGAGTNYAVVGSITDKGVYTITAEKTGTGAKKWGKLKSGMGWIALDYSKKV